MDNAVLITRDHSLFGADVKGDERNLSQSSLVREKSSLARCVSRVNLIYQNGCTESKAFFEDPLEPARPLFSNQNQGIVFALQGFVSPLNRFSLLKISLLF
jgi:hypothetical protein